MKGLVLSGGSGTRLRPLTFTGAKQLIPVANKPIIFYGIDALVDAGIKEIGIVVGTTAEEVQKVVGDGSRWNVSITYIHQSAPMGLAHAIKISREFLGDESFIMYLGDNILKNGIRDFVFPKSLLKGSTSVLRSRVAHPKTKTSPNRAAMNDLDSTLVCMR